MVRPPSQSSGRRPRRGAGTGGGQLIWQQTEQFAGGVRQQGAVDGDPGGRRASPGVPEEFDQPAVPPADAGDIQPDRAAGRDHWRDRRAGNSGMWPDWAIQSPANASTSRPLARRTCHSGAASARKAGVNGTPSGPGTFWPQCCHGTGATTGLPRNPWRDSADKMPDASVPTAVRSMQVQRLARTGRWTSIVRPRGAGTAWRRPPRQSDASSRPPCGQLDRGRLPQQAALHNVQQVHRIKTNGCAAP